MDISCDQVMCPSFNNKDHLSLCYKESSTCEKPWRFSHLKEGRLQWALLNDSLFSLGALRSLCHLILRGLRGGFSYLHFKDEKTEDHRGQGLK